mmetsp:Transcript_16946/g.26090  ORF Transcript_16946/g.26090 Transcript_16946/m.26090 type:complete len:92 (+) Transcript_16946:601-876(+)
MLREYETVVPKGSEEEGQKQPLTLSVLKIDPKIQEGDECVICLANKKNCAFYPCGHQCLCLECSVRFKTEARHQVCPLCRQRVKDIIEVFQ